MISNHPNLLAYRESTPRLCMWALASKRSIYLTRATFTCGHMGHAFWTCPLKVAGVGMGSPRLARIIGFLGCTQIDTMNIDLHKVLSSIHCVNIVLYQKMQK